MGANMESPVVWDCQEEAGDEKDADQDARHFQINT